MDIEITATIPGGPHYTVAGVTYELPSYFEARITDIHDVPYDVELGVQMRRGGPEARSVTVRQQLDERGRPQGPYVTSTGIRVPVAQLLEATVEHAVSVAHNVKEDRDAGEKSATLTRPTAEQAQDFYRQWRNDERGGSRRMIDDGFLQDVAEIYRAALSVGDPPTQTVADVLGGARSSAGRWVMQARDRGFLGPAPRERQHGEVQEDDR